MEMSKLEKVIKGLHDARRYLEDKEWSDRGASPHIDAINDALSLLKEQEAKPLCCKECSYHRNDGWCNEHGREVKESDYCSFGA